MSNSNKTKVEIKIRRAMDGEEEALNYLGVREIQILPSKTTKMTWPLLCANYNYYVQVYTAAEKLGLNILKTSVKDHLNMLGWISRMGFKKEIFKETTLASTDSVLEMMRGLCTDLPKKTFVECNGESSSEDDDDEQQPKRAEEDPKSPAKKKCKSREKEKEKEDDDDNDYDDDDEQQPKGAAEHPKSLPKKKPKMREKRTHPKTKKCRIPGYSFKGYDIKRHLEYHKKRGEIDEAATDKLCTIKEEGKKTRGARIRKKGKQKTQPRRRKKWCPVKRCNKAVQYLSKHLRNAHKLTPKSAVYHDMLKIAKPYKELEEIDKYLAKDEELEEPEGPEELEEPPSNSKDQPSTNKVPPSIWKPSASKEPLLPYLEPQQQSDGSCDDDEPEEEENKCESSDSESKWEEDPENETKEEYYSATKYQNKRHQWLCGFFHYLSLPDGGYKKTRNRLQHVSQVSIVLEHLDPGGDDITP